MERRAAGDQLPLTFDAVVELEAHRAQDPGRGVHEQQVIEARRLDVTHVRFEDQRLHAELGQTAVFEPDLAHRFDAARLEERQEVAVVDDASRVGVGEANPYLSWWYDR